MPGLAWFASRHASYYYYYSHYYYYHYYYYYYYWYYYYYYYNPISKSNDKFINRDNNRNSNRNTTAVAITIALATAIANANEHTKIVRITFVWGPRAGIIFLASPEKSVYPSEMNETWPRAF